MGKDAIRCREYREDAVLEELDAFGLCEGDFGGEGACGAGGAGGAYYR